uniref:Uncharacterized protein n=1 Tax=Caenorhabditis japonica TaxID=281687 RepID=A0A8R1E001_CAEJA
MLIGSLACLTATVCLGSVFAPIKKFPASDGFMVQFFMSLGGFVVSLAIHALLGFPPIYGLAMIGGAIWCIEPRQESVTIRAVCLIAAVFSGFFYGSMCTPVTFVQNRPDLYPGAPSEGLPYLFSFFCGVLGTSALVLVGYSAVKKNTPTLPPYLVLPSMLAGVLFAVGMGGFFVGNEKLSQTIAYPICSFAPGIVVSGWSVLYFKEITGKRNLILLGIAYAFTLVGVAMVTVSKDL